MTSSHLDRLAVTFDSPTLVSNAGLLLPAILGQRLGLADLVQRHVKLGEAAGAPNPGAKAMTVMASLLAGGDCIDDVDALRKGNTEIVLGSTVLAPSTIRHLPALVQLRARPSDGRGAGRPDPASLGRWRGT